MTMTCRDLPVGWKPKPVPFPHFPAPHQAVLWRNWELVPVKRLAAVLKATEAQVLAAAAALGLRVPPLVSQHMLKRGYVTLIRENWHLLPYEQILTLLDWTPERMDYTLREEDFFWHKLGFSKPNAKPVRLRPLSAAEARRTAEIRQTIQNNFPDLAAADPQPPFAFLDAMQQAPRGKIVAPKALGAFDLRYIYSYSALYGDTLADPELDPFPDGMLARLAETGVNGVWLQGILYTLVPWKVAPELSAGWQTRLANLRRLTERAARFGIGVYLYLNEPRAQRLTFFEKHPDLKGVYVDYFRQASLCTSRAPVIDFLYDSTARLFREVPRLAGAFTISMSENLTNCYSRGTGDQCPLCSKRSPAEVVAEVNRTIAAGIHSAKPEARVIVWTWSWDPKWARTAIDLLPTDVALMCTSEEAKPLRIGGVKETLYDYSMAQVGPGERSRGNWAHARQRGLKTVAKVQFNNTWECSAVPYIPVPDLVEKHIANLRKAGVTGVMLSWTTGGYPSPNLKLLSTSARKLAEQSFGPRAAPQVRWAWRAFSRAFPNFTHTVATLYNGPQNYGPMNLLFEKPTGYHATMIGYPYDDIKNWLGPYPKAVFLAQWRKLSEGWRAGLAILRRAQALVPPDKMENFRDLDRVATATYCHFRSSYLQARFVQLRDGKERNRRKKILAVLEEERDLARTLHAIASQDSRIGFEASNHYYYTINDLREKVLNVEYLKKRF